MYQPPVQPIQQPVVVSVVEEQPQIPYAEPVEPMYVGGKSQKQKKEDIRDPFIPEATPSRTYNNGVALKVGYVFL